MSILACSHSRSLRSAGSQDSTVRAGPSRASSCKAARRPKWAACAGSASCNTPSTSRRLSSSSPIFCFSREQASFSLSRCRSLAARSLLGLGQLGGQGLENVGGSLQALFFSACRSATSATRERQSSSRKSRYSPRLERAARRSRTVCWSRCRAAMRRPIFTQLFLEATGLVLQRGDLGRVVPAQHVTTAVVDAVPVVLFVALARHLDLAGPG